MRGPVKKKPISDTSLVPKHSKEVQIPTIKEMELAIGQPIQLWPRYIANAVKTPGNKLGYSAEKHSTEARRVVFAFLINNGVPPTCALQWLLDRKHIKSDCLSEFSWILKLVVNGEYYTPVDVFFHGWICKSRFCKPVFEEQEILRFRSMVKTTATHSVKNLSEAFTSRLVARKHYFKHNFPLTLVCKLLHSKLSPWQYREIVVQRGDATDGLIGRSVPKLSMSRISNGINFKWSSLHAGRAFDPITQSPLADVEMLRTELVLELDEPPIELAHLTEDVSDALINNGILWWKWLNHALGILHYILGKYFGITQVFMFASGSKSPHMWCMDEFLLRQTHAERTSFFKILQDPTQQPWWNSVFSSHCLPFYETMHATFGLPERSRSLAEIVALTYPRFDSGVAIGRSHIHRMPFSVHEKTGRIAIPFLLGRSPKQTSDMPLVDDPHLVARLSEPLRILDCAIQSRAAAFGIEFEPTFSRAYDRIVKDSEQRIGESLAPIHIYQKNVLELKRLLEIAITSENQQLPTELSQLLLKGDHDTWEKKVGRFKYEKKKLGLLVNLDYDENGIYKLDSRRVMDTSSFRMQIFHPVMNYTDFFKTIHESSRHTITAHRLLALDIKSSHPSCAWSAVKSQLGYLAAKETCPNLHLLVHTSPERLLEEVNKTRRPWITINEAKINLLKALNMSTHYNGMSDIEIGLINERSAITDALMVFPPISSNISSALTLAADGKSLLSLLMQAVEDCAIQKAIPQLEQMGWVFVAPISDCILLDWRPGSVPLTREFCNASALAMAYAARSLAIQIRVKVEHYPGSVPN